jgi:hypothetical protein
MAIMAGRNKIAFTLHVSRQGKVFVEVKPILLVAMWYPILEFDYKQKIMGKMSPQWNEGIQGQLDRA